MAEVVLGIGTSHTPMLFTPAEDWPKYEARDRRAELVGIDGTRVDYETLLASAGESVRRALTPEGCAQAYQLCQASLDRLAAVIEDEAPDVIIIIGDDQKELFLAENLPAMLIYWGETLTTRFRPPREGEPAWWSEALAKYYGRGRDETHPVAATLARHVIERLVGSGFDVAQSTGLAPGKGEGHAFAFVFSRLLRYRPVPVLPIFLNTYYPPNQPTPARCYQLGKAIDEAVQCFTGDERVAVVASGGLSHFVVDPDLDRMVLGALATQDAEKLAMLPAQKLNSGTSEIRNWIAMCGATSRLDHSWTEYVPAYRSLAGTGTGCAFGVWR